MTPKQHTLQLAELFNALDDVVVWVKDRQGRYSWVNRAFLLNYTLNHRGDARGAQPPDVIGKTDYDLSPPFIADQFRLDDEHVLAGNRIVNRIELVGQPDGLTRWNVTNKIPVCDAEGQIVGTAGITRQLDSRDRENASESGFSSVLSHMRDHYQRAITNEQLAQLANMSVRAFERKFRGAFHVTPQKYLRKLRMRLASRALVYTNQSLVEVALSCGFADQSHFTREFHRHFGRTPREYRQHYGHPGEPDVGPGTSPGAPEQ